MLEIEQRLKQHVSYLTETIGPRSLVYDEVSLRNAGNYVKNVWVGQGFVVDEQQFKVADSLRTGSKSRSASNLEMVIPGRGVSADFVIGAHYDSVVIDSNRSRLASPGANDNATGVAALLEITRLLKKKGQPQQNLKFVAFANEEPPFFGTSDMGSYHYAQRMFELSQEIHLMISLDGLGFYSNEPNSQQVPEGIELIKERSQGNFLAFITEERTLDEVEAFRRTFEGFAQLPTVLAYSKTILPNLFLQYFNPRLFGPISPLGYRFKNPLVATSDHGMFWLFDYPAAVVSDTSLLRYPHYHKETDTIDKIDFGKLARVTYGLAEAIHQLAS